MTEAPAYRVPRWPGFGGAAVSPVPQGPVLFEAVRATIAMHVRFAEDWALDLAALWVLQSYIATYLPSAFYVFLSGAKGKAKTTVLDLLCALTGGLNASDVSVAALVHWLDENRGGAICIDEVDVRRDAERDSALAAICRNGYTPGKPYLRYDVMARRVDGCPTYGAKALGFRSKVDDALEDRGFTLPTADVRGRAGAQLVRQNFMRDVGDLPSRLENWSKTFLHTRRDARLDTIVLEEMGQDSWMEMVEDVVGVGNVGANRETQLTMVALAVCRAACIDLTASLRLAFGLRREVAAANTDEDLEEARDVLEEIIGTTPTLTKETEVYVVRQGEFVTRLNARRKDRGLARALTTVQVAALRNELGIRPTWLRRPKNKTTWNIPATDRDTVLGRGLPNLPNLPNPLVLDGGVSQVRCPLPAGGPENGAPGTPLPNPAEPPLTGDLKQRVSWLRSVGRGLEADEIEAHPERYSVPNPTEGRNGGGP